MPDALPVPNPAFLKKLGIRYPIFAAPTGSIAGPELAVAVSEAGALGAMGLTWTPPDEAAQMVRQVKSQTGKPFQVNFALAFEPRALPAVLDAGVPIVTFSWGDPAPYIASVRAAGSLFGVQVTNAEGAKRAIELGADFLVCQGVEAGGHVQATTPLWETLGNIVDVAGETPVVAAGGIKNGMWIFRALHAMGLGASGAMFGTRFVATIESRAHPKYKQALVEAGPLSRTPLTTCFDGGWPQAAHRVLRNPTLDTWEAHGCPPSGRRPGEGDIVARSASGEPILRYEDTAPRIGHTGNIHEMCLYAGTGVRAITEILPARKVVQQLWSEYLEAVTAHR